MTALPTPHAAENPDRRATILRTAARLFAEHGFNGVGMRTIAAEAGIRGSSIYHYFDSKLDLLQAIGMLATQEFVEQQLPRFLTSGTPTERIHAVLRTHITYFWDHHVDVDVALRELRELDTPRLKTVNNVRAQYQNALLELIEEGCATGSFHVTDVQMATFAVLDMVNGVRQWFKPDGRLTIRQVADRYADYATYGVLGAVYDR